MAKNSPKTDTSTASEAPAPTPSLTMGTVATVVCPEGAVLRNNETGGTFTPGMPTEQVVTATLLRRLADGDLVLV